MDYEPSAPFQSTRRWRQLATALCGMSLVILALVYLQFGPEVYMPRQNLAHPVERGMDKLEVVNAPSLVFATDTRYEAILKQVVLVTSSDSRGKVRNSSGFIVAKDLVMTDRHLFPDGTDSPTQVTCFGIRWTAIIIKTSASADFAILNAPGCGGEKVTFATETPRVDEPLEALGLDINLQQRTAKYLRIRTRALPNPSLEMMKAASFEDEYGAKIVGRILTDGTDLVTVAGYAPRGFSGGPIIRPNGDIVGMTSFADSANQRSHAIGAADLVIGLSQVSVK